MTTKVFISWSGELSRKVGEALRNWLPATLQYVRPYFSPDDIEKGAKWNSEIAKELESSDVGIICLTRGNTESPWVLFESGALSKSLDKAHVCTLLFNLDPADIKGPLTSFQATKFERDDFKRLFTTINNVAGDAKLETLVLDDVFKMWWPQLSKQVDEILNTHDGGTKRPQRSERDMLEEVLELTRMYTLQAQNQPRISARAVGELMDQIASLMPLVFNQDPNMGQVMVERINPLLRVLCREVGLPEQMYERYVVSLPHVRPNRTASRPIQRGPFQSEPQPDTEMLSPSKRGARRIARLAEGLSPSASELPDGP